MKGLGYRENSRDVGTWCDASSVARGTRSSGGQTALKRLGVKRRRQQLKLELREMVEEGPSNHERRLEWLEAREAFQRWETLQAFKLYKASSCSDPGCCGEVGDLTFGPLEV